MRLRDLIFGKPKQERRFVDPLIGELTAEVRPGHEDKWHSWSGRSVLTGQTQPTIFSLCGDGRAPHRAHLEEVHLVLQRRAELHREGFVLAVVNVWDEHSNILELDFVSDGTVTPVDLEWAGHRVRYRGR